MNGGQIRNFEATLKTEMFEEAFQILLTESKRSGTTEEVKILSKKLSSEVRKKAYSLANKKDEKGALKLENLLKKIIKLNDEGIYG